MCPILKAGDLSSIVDEAVFLNEVDVALWGIGAQPVPRGASVAEAARWCLGRLSDALLAERRRQVVGTANNPPLTRVFAPVDLDAIHADPACTAEYFARVLRAWGIGREVPGCVERGIPDAVSRLDVTTRGVHRLRSRLPGSGHPLPDWSMDYVPFSLLSGEVGLLFAFTAAADRPAR